MADFNQSYEFVPSTPADPASLNPPPNMPTAEGVAPARPVTGTFSQGYEFVPKAPTDPTKFKFPEQERPNAAMQAVQRIFATDVEDPLTLERMSTSTLGAFLGASIGTRTPTAPGKAGLIINPMTGAALGSLGGSLAGFVAPEATMEALELAGLLPEGEAQKQGITLSSPELGRILEGELMLQVLLGTGLQAVRQGTRAVVGKAAGVTPEDRALADAAARLGVDLPTFVAASGRLGPGAINVLGRFPFIGGETRQWTQKAVDSWLDITAEIPGRVGNVLSSSELSKKIYKSSKVFAKGVSKYFERRYTQLYAEATAKNVYYRPQNTLQVGRQIIDEIKKRAATKADGTPGGMTLAMESAIELIENNFSDLGNQSLRSMDTLMGVMDGKAEHIAKSLGRSGDAREFQKLISPLRGALKMDVVKNGIGSEAPAIGQKLADLDTKFSATMREYMETATAKRMESVSKGGLRAPLEEATRTSIDRLAQTVVKMDEPAALADLKKIVAPKVWKEISAHYLGQAFEQSIKRTANGQVLSVDSLRDFLGITGRGIVPSNRAASAKILLEGAGYTPGDIKTLMGAAEALSMRKMPNASDFMMRRATLGGARSLMSGALPFAMLAGGGTGHVVGGPAGAAIGSLMFFYSAKGVVKALSNPMNVRSFKTILDQEASLQAKRAAYIGMIRTVSAEMLQQGETTKEFADAAMGSAVDLVDQLIVKEGEQK